MRTYEQLQQMDRAVRDMADAFQRLGCASCMSDETNAYDAFQRAQELYQAAKEGRIDDAPPDVIRPRVGVDANGSSL